MSSQPLRFSGLSLSASLNAKDSNLIPSLESASPSEYFSATGSLNSTLFHNDVGCALLLEGKHALASFSFIQALEHERKRGSKPEPVEKGTISLRTLT